MNSNSEKNADKNHGVETFKKYKNLLGELTQKNIKLKYRESWIGILWSFFQPLLNMTVLSVVFSGMFGRSSEYCYPVFLFTGRLLFDFFIGATKQAMTSFRRNAPIIKKVYVPKYMYPISSILSNFVSLAISLICLVVVWIFFKCTGISDGSELAVTPYVLLCVVPMLLILIFSTGVGLILSVFTVYFRDIEYIWDVTTKLLFYMVPIIYPMEKIKSDWIIVLIKINPLYSMIELFRQCVLYGYAMSWKLLLYGTVTSVAALIAGILIFRWKSDDLVYHL